MDTDDPILKILVAVIFGIMLLVSIAGVGMRLGIGEGHREILIVGGLVAALLFGALTRATPYSAIGLIIFFVVTQVGIYIELDPSVNLQAATVSCIVSAALIALALKWSE